MTLISVRPAHAWFIAPIVTWLGSSFTFWGLTLTVGQWIMAAVTVASIAYSIFKSYTTDQLQAPESKYVARELTNSFSNEGIIPILYGGPLRIGGNIVWQSNPAETVHRFLALSVGQIAGVESVQVDEIPIGQISGCSYSFYSGSRTQTPDSRCAGVAKGLRHLGYLAITLTSSDSISGNPVTSI